MNISPVASVSQTLPVQSNSLITKISNHITASPSLSSISNAAKTLNDFANNKSLSFQIDGTTGSVIVKVIDTKNLQMISQMPGEQALIMAQSVKNNLSNPITGMLIRTTA
jgi:uncharacterized FlaG/YvyC family protein